MSTINLICIFIGHSFVQIDLRFGDKDEGALQVVVAPVLRFKDVGFNARVTLDELGTPDKIISGFAPELFGTPLNDEDVLETRVINKDGLQYYEWYGKLTCVQVAYCVQDVRSALLCVT